MQRVTTDSGSRWRYKEWRSNKGVLIKRKRSLDSLLLVQTGKKQVYRIFVCCDVLELLPMMQGASLVSSQYMSAAMIPP